MNLRARSHFGTAAAAVVLIALAGCTGAAPTASPMAATATPGAVATDPPATTSATAGAGEVTELLHGGRYLFWPQELPSLTLAATGPDGWRGFPSWALDGPDEPWGAKAPSGVGIAFFTPDGIYSDPCHWDVLGNGVEGQPGDIVVGPSVDDLVAALRANTFYTSTAAVPVTIDGYSGKELELQLPMDPFLACDKAPGDENGHVFVFSGGAGLYAQGPANRWHLFILDVDGIRFVAVVLSYEGTPQADLETAKHVIDTMDFHP